MVNNKRKIARVALYLFVFSLNFEIFNLLGDFGNLSIGRLTGLIYIGTLLLIGTKFKLNRFHNLLYTLITFFVIISISSMLHLNEISYTIFDISLFQNGVLFFVLLIHERNDQGVLEKSLYSLSLGSLIFCVLYLMGIGINYNQGGRLSIFGDNPNGIGIRMVVSMTFLIYYGILSSMRLSLKRVALILPIPIMFFILLETGSRVSVISFVLLTVIMLILYFLVDPIKRFVPSMIFFGLVLGLMIPFILSNELILYRLLASKEGDLAGRDIIWQFYIEYILKSPLIGYGYSGFAKIANLNNGGSPHNVFIGVLLYGGLFALLPFVWFNGQVFFNGLRMYVMKKEYLGLLLFIPYIGMIISGQSLINKLMWFILAFNCISLCKQSSSGKINITHYPPRKKFK